MQGLFSGVVRASMGVSLLVIIVSNEERFGCNVIQNSTAAHSQSDLQSSSR